MSDRKNLRVFISHSSFDDKIVDKIREKFDEYKISYFADHANDLESKKVNRKINSEFNKSTDFLLIWSNNTKSEYVEDEISAATNKKNNKEIHIFIVEGTTNSLPVKIDDFFHHTVNENNIADKTEQLIRKLDGVDFETQIKLLKEKVCSDYENYPDSSQLSTYAPIIAGFRKFNGHKLYLAQPYNFVTHENYGSKSVIDFCLDKIKDFTTIKKNVTSEETNEQQALLIVGDYGNGKSGLCYKLVYFLCKRSAFKGKLPLFIPLGSLTKIDHEDEISKERFETEIYEYVTKQYDLKLTKNDFSHKVNQGKIIFIFDALDELSNKLDSKIAQKALNQLLGFSNETFVVVTSRHTYIHDGIPKTLVEYESAIKILDFDEERVTKFLRLRFSEQKIIDEIQNKITNNSRLKAITRKPIFLNIFCERFEKLKDMKFINEAILFRILTVGWIQHDMEKPDQLIISDEEEKIEINTRCSERLAVKELEMGIPVTQEDIKSIIEDEFKNENADIESEFESYIRYARESTFLSVEANNSFRFILRPLLEYFVASRLVREISEYEKARKIDYLTSSNVNLQILEFIKWITEAIWLIKPQFLENENISDKRISSKIDKSENLSKIIKENRNKDTWLGNVVRILHTLNLVQYAMNLSYLNLQGADLTQTNFNHVYFSHCNLKGVKFSDSNLSHADFSHSDLEGTDLSSCMLNGADFKHATITRTKFNNSNLVYSKFDSANLRDTKFHFSNLINSRYDNAYIEIVQFINCSLVSANFRKVRYLRITKIDRCLVTRAVFNQNSFSSNDAGIKKILLEGGAFFRN